MSYESQIWNSESNLHKRYSVLDAVLVPGMGNCKTIEGECLRAVSQVGYRYFNDGDYFYEGYGCETAGPAHAFLVDHSPLKHKLRPIFSEAAFGSKEQYERAIDDAVEMIVSWIEEKQGVFTPNTLGLDMLECEAHYEEEPEEGYY